MSPLWSEEALTQAAWAQAVESGRVNLADVKDVVRPVVRRIPRARVSSFAL